MTTRRLAKAAEAIRETVSTTVLFGLRDPRVKNVTVLGAEAAPDLRTAKVFISIMGTPKEQSLCLYGLESARGYIQAKLADRLQTKYTPVLKFVLDPAVKRSTETSRVLREVLPPEDDETDNEDEQDDEEYTDEEDTEDDDGSEHAAALSTGTAAATDDSPDQHDSHRTGSEAVGSEAMTDLDETDSGKTGHGSTG